MDKVEEGVYVVAGAAEKSLEEMRRHYLEYAITILDGDRGHYGRFVRAMAGEPFLKREFGSVADIAGGHPKMASMLRCRSITVYDELADLYEELHGEFIERFPTEADIEYRKERVDRPDFRPEADLAICCHILEHLDVNVIDRLLGNLQTGALLIYGPNFEKAEDEDWLHYTAPDHRTFISLNAMVSKVEKAGFRVLTRRGYDEDYVIYGERLT